MLIFNLRLPQFDVAMNQNQALTHVVQCFATTNCIKCEKYFFHETIDGLTGNGNAGNASPRLII